MMENLTTRYYYKYSQFEKDIRKIIKWLKPQRNGYTKFGEEPWEPDLIVSVNRGGLIPGVYLSHALNVPHFPIHYQTREFNYISRTVAGHKREGWYIPGKPQNFDYDIKILLVDDINDSGKTFSDIWKHWDANNLGVVPLRKRIKTVSLIERKGSKFAVDYSPVMLDVKDWVVFPWEDL
jgi:hypoxanthine phosphoribosyltransferase